PRVAEAPFTSERKRMTTIHETAIEPEDSQAPWRSAHYVSFTKGAVDSLLDISKAVWLGNRAVPLDDEMRARITQANEEMAQNGQRVLGVAFRALDDEDMPPKGKEETLEQELVFIGLIGML